MIVLETLNNLRQSVFISDIITVYLTTLTIFQLIFFLLGYIVFTVILNSFLPSVLLLFLHILRQQPHFHQFPPQMPTYEEDVLQEEEGSVNLSVVAEEQQGEGEETVRKEEMAIYPSQHYCHRVVSWVLLPPGNFSWNIAIGKIVKNQFTDDNLPLLAHIAAHSFSKLTTMNSLKKVR